MEYDQACAKGWGAEADIVNFPLPLVHVLLQNQIRCGGGEPGRLQWETKEES